MPQIRPPASTCFPSVQPGIASMTHDCRLARTLAGMGELRVCASASSFSVPRQERELSESAVTVGERRFEIGLTSKSRNTMIFFPAQSCLSSLTTTAFASAERTCRHAARKWRKAGAQSGSMQNGDACACVALAHEC